MSSQHTAEDKLQRILYILPTAAREGGVPLQHLADALEIEPGEVLRDLEEATARTFFHPAATVEPFTIMVEADRVDVRAQHHFNRPVRLSTKETLALGIGLRAMAAEAAEPRRSQVLALAERLEASLAAPDVSVTAPHARATEDGVEYPAPDLTVWPGGDSLRGAIADAVDRTVMCDVWYLKPGAAAPEQRRIAPFRLIYSAGTWYVAALDAQRDGLRFFRLDRMLDVTVTEEPAPPLREADSDRLRSAPYAGVDEVEVTVRYEREATRVVHRVSDLRWLIRHVMNHGGRAVVEAPSDVRRYVASFLADAGLLDSYGGTTA